MCHALQTEHPGSLEQLWLQHVPKVPQDWDVTLCKVGAGQASSELGSPLVRGTSTTPCLDATTPTRAKGMRPSSIFNAELQYFGFSAQL